jgi:2-oxoglutarate dehydrogenase E1 component
MSNDKMTLLKQQTNTSFLFGGSAAYLEEQYELYLQDPDSVSPEWKKHFDALPKVNGNALGDVSHSAIRAHFTELARHPVMGMSTADACSIEQVQKQAHVLQLINAYRHQGHRLANLDPLGLREFPIIPALQLSHYDLSSSDLATEFETNSLSVAMAPRATLANIIDTLKKIYCSSIGFEYIYIND